MEKFYSPRWRSQFVTIGATTHIPLPSQYFANNEIWDWHLKHLVVVGTADLDAAGDYTNAIGGVARRLRFKVGTSQKGPINVVPSNGQAMFGPDRTYLVHSNDLNIGAAFRFDPKYPYYLPADSGIGALVRNEGSASIQNLGCLFLGHEKPEDAAPGIVGDRNPVHFGSYTTMNLQTGNQEPLEGADLFNDGENDAELTDMILQGFAMSAGEVSVDTWDQVHWRINPTTGPQWMPDPDPIPVGCLCPFNRGIQDPSDVGPRAYAFPPGTILKPRQRISVEAYNYAADDQEFHICLFGYLEVT